MSEEETVSPEYQKGLNQGYIIAKYAPELAQHLAKIEATTPQLQALQDGIKTCALERLKAFEKTKNNSRDISSDKERDKDITPER